MQETTVLVNEVPQTTPASTETSFSIVGASEYSHQFNEAVGISNETKILYAQESTQIGNIAALTASLTDTLSARFSFEVRLDLLDQRLNLNAILVRESYQENLIDCIFLQLVFY